MKFENFGTSRSYEREQIIEKAGDKAAEALADEAIDPNDFADLYGQEAVDADLAYVERMQTTFDREATHEQRNSARAASIAEVTLGDGIGLHDWMGPSAYFVVPSKYDDIRHGIDGLVEFEEDAGKASHMGLALDATYRSDSESKLYKIRNKIESGDAMRMKYFTSEALDFRGELRNLPHTVAAFDIGTIARLGEMWLTKDKQALAKDPVQFQILEQLMAQCELFEKVAGTDRPNLSGRYEHARTILGEIYKQRQQEIDDTGVRDENSYRLISAINSMKKS